jgi:hypothetical protein
VGIRASISEQYRKPFDIPCCVVNSTPPTFVTTHAIARRAGRSRAVVERLLRLGMKPDGFVEMGGTCQPIFLPERTIDVLKSIGPKRRSATPLPVRASEPPPSLS